MKDAALFLLSFVVCVACCGCGHDAASDRATDPSSQSVTVAQAPEIPVVKPSPAPWKRAKEFEWQDDKPEVTMLHRDEGFAYLTGVQGVMPHGSRVNVVTTPEGDWKLSGSNHRGTFGRAAACPWFVDAEWPLETKDWKTNQPDFPKLIHQRDGFCVPLMVGGRLVGSSDEFRLHVDANGYWRLRARSKSPTTRVRVAIIKLKQPRSFKGEAREHVWRHGDQPVRLIHSRDGIAFLSGLTGTFWGQSDWARVTLHDDGYWYLEGQSANKQDITARAMTIRLSGNQATRPVIAANDVSAGAPQTAAGAWAEAQWYRWEKGKPAVQVTHVDDGFAILAGVGGDLLSPPKQIEVVTNAEGNWVLKGESPKAYITAGAYSMPWFGSIERPLPHKAWKKGQPPLRKLIHQKDGFCVLRRVGGGFRGGGETIRLRIAKDGYWMLDAHSLTGGTRAEVTVIKMKQPGSFQGVAREHSWKAGQKPVRLIHSNDGFAILAGVSGKFAGRGEWVRVQRDDKDGYWYLIGQTGQRSLQAWAYSIRFTDSATEPPPPVVTSTDPKPSPPTTSEKPKPPSKAEVAIAALKKLGFDVSEDGTSVDIGYSGGDQIKDDDLVHLRSLPDVLKLGLYEVPLSDKGVQHLSGLKKLQHLRLGNSQITDEGLKVIGGLTNLETLDLGECQSVTGAGLMHLKELTNLRELSITGVDTRAGDLAFANGLLNLEQFDFRTFGDVLNESDLQVLGRLTKLTMLSLNGSEAVDNRTISHLSNLKSLFYLVLNGTRISDRAMQTVKELPGLRVLKVSGTRVDDLGIKSLAGMESLEEIHLSGTKVSNRGISALADCPNLRELFLQGPGTTDRQLAGLKDVKQLKRLYLNGDYDFREERPIPTRITLNGIRLVSELEQLELLHLTDNPQINDLAVPFLSKLKNLSTLKLGGTIISPQGGRKIADEIERLDYDDLDL